MCIDFRIKMFQSQDYLSCCIDQHTLTKITSDIRYYWQYLVYNRTKQVFINQIYLLCLKKGAVINCV